MDEKQIEILQQNRSNFLQAVDPERILAYLKEDEIFDEDELAKITSINSPTERLENILDLLIYKGAQAYTTFCLAIENTYPELLTAMLRSQHQGHDVTVPNSQSSPMVRGGHLQEPMQRSSPRSLEILHPPPIPPMPVSRNESYGKGDSVVGRTDSFGRNEPTRRNESFGKSEQMNRNDSFGRNDMIGRSDSFGRNETMRNDFYPRNDVVLRSESFGRVDPTTRSGSFRSDSGSRSDSFRGSDQIRRNNSFGRTDQALRSEPFNRNDPANRSDSFGRGDHASKRMDPFIRGDQTRRSESFGRSDHSQEPMLRGHHGMDSSKMIRGPHTKESPTHRSSDSFRSHDRSKDSLLDRRHYVQERQSHPINHASIHERNHVSERSHTHETSTLERKSHQERGHPSQDRPHIHTDSANMERRSYESSTLERRSKGERRGHHNSDPTRHIHSQDQTIRSPHGPDRTHTIEPVQMAHSVIPVDKAPMSVGQHPHSLEPLTMIRGMPQEPVSKGRGLPGGKVPSPLDRSPCNSEPPPLPSVPPPNIPVKESRGGTILENEEERHTQLLGVSISKPPDEGPPRSYAPRPVSVHEYTASTDPCQEDISLLRAEIKLLPIDREGREGRREDHALSPDNYKRMTMNTDLVKPPIEKVTNHNYDWLKSQCDWAMKELQSLKHQHGETVDKCDRAVKDAESQRRHSKKAQEENVQYQNKILMLNSQYTQLAAEKDRLEKEVEDLQKQVDENNHEMSELRQQQMEAMSESGSFENFSVMYDTYVNKYEAVKQDYNNLRKMYTDKVASLNASTREVEELQGQNDSWKQRYEEAEREKNTAVKECKRQKTHITAAIQAYNREKSDLLKELHSVKMERDEYKRQIAQATAEKAKATKSIASITKERDAVVHEYTLVMSERDTVHKEIEQLTDKLTNLQKKYEQAENDKKAYYKENENHRREFSNVQQDRDRVMKQYNDLKERLGDRMPDVLELERQRENLRKEIEKLISERELHQRDTSKRGLDSFDRSMKDISDSKETENLRKENERLQAELTDSLSEMEGTKEARDWAFVERDKIVKERESIKTLCDKLRKERDDAISKLIEAVRDSDELKKQKSDALKELKELKEKYEALIEREARKNQLASIGHTHSRDSAIDTDLQEWETETLELEMMRADKDDMGFDLVGGKEDIQFRNDSAIFVSNVRQSTFAYGKLKVNDHLVKVNSVDVSSVEKSVVFQTIRQGGSVVYMVVRRRRLVSTRAVVPVTITLSADRELGISVEQGLYVSRIIPSSAAAREGNLAVGDRILFVNDSSVENMSVSDVMRLALEADRVTFSVMKYCPTPQPSIASSSSMSSGPNFTESSPEVPSLSPRSPHSSSRIWISPSPDSADGNKVPSSTNLKNSCGSQTDSLDSPKTSARNSGQEPEREKMNILDKAINMIGKPFRNACTTDRSERDAKCKSSGNVISAPSMEEDQKHRNLHPAEEEVIEHLNAIIKDYSQQSPILSPMAPNMASKPCKAEKEGKRRRRESGGTWPRCRVHVPYNVSQNGWPPVVPKKERPPLMALVNENEYVTSPKSPSHDTMPPKPPERSDSFHRGDSFKRSASVKHSPQNSDPTVKYALINNMTQLKGSSSKSNPHSSSPTKESHIHTSDASSGLVPKRGSPMAQSLDSSDTQSRERKDQDSIARDRNHMDHKASSLHYVTHSPSESSAPSHSSQTPDLSVKSGNQDDILKYVMQIKGKERTRPTSAPSRSRRRPPRGGEFRRDYPPQKPTSLDVQPMYSPRPIPNSRGLPITSAHSSAHSGMSATQALSPMARTMVVSSPPGPLSPRETSSSHQHVKTTPQYPTSVPAPFQVISSVNPPVYLADSRPTSHDYTSPMPYTSGSRSGDQLASSIPEMGSEQAHRPVYSKGGPDLRNSSSPSPSPSQQSSSLDDFPHQHIKPRVPKSHGHLPPTVDSGHSTFPHRRPPHLPYIPDRYRIPSNPSVSSSKSSVSRISTSSFERMSDRCSPISPGFWPPDYPHTPGTSSSLPIPKPRRPEVGEKRDIKVEKGSENLGIQIECGSRGGIFVSSVSDNSLASRAGISVGDQLLEVCGINMRNANKNVAASVLRQTGGSVNMRVQYNPDKYYQEGFGSYSDDDSEEFSESDTPSRSRKAAHRVSNETITPETCSPIAMSPSTLSPSHSAISGESFPAPCDPRVLILKKLHPQDELGLTIVGGNNVGIFVQAVQPNSIAAGNPGLRCGDQILMINGVDFRILTAEQATLEVNKTTENYYIKAQYNIAKYEKLSNLAWDDIYVRAMFDRHAEKEMELSFQKGDILCVDSTLYNGVLGTWRALLVDEDGKKVCCGTIPSKFKLEEEFVAKRSLSEADDELKGSRRGSASARRSFFRRKKHQRNNSKDSREFNSFSDASINSDSASFLADDSIPATYERVERLDNKSCRPVHILGPLADPLIAKLTSESPDRYCRCEPASVKTTIASMETGQEDGVIIDFKPLADGQFACLSVQAVKDIIDKNRHCMLNLHPSTIERLHKVHIYPIVLFIRHKNAKQIREVKDTRFMPDKLSNKAAKEIFETFHEYEQKFKKHFSDQIQGGNLAMMGVKIKSAIEKEQRKTVWVPSGSL